MTASACRCHSDQSLYGSLQRCLKCGHRSLDPGIGCERRRCGYEVSTAAAMQEPLPLEQR